MSTQWRAAGDKIFGPTGMIGTAADPHNAALIVAAHNKAQLPAGITSLGRVADTTVNIDTGEKQ